MPHRNAASTACFHWFCGVAGAPVQPPHQLARCPGARAQSPAPRTPAGRSSITSRSSSAAASRAIRDHHRLAAAPAGRLQQPQPGVRRATSRPTPVQPLDAHGVPRLAQRQLHPRHALDRLPARPRQRRAPSARPAAATTDWCRSVR